VCGGRGIQAAGTVAILESMRMQMPVEAADSGTVTGILREERQAVDGGATS
jgi:biotin carboxyl carrier protein